MNAYIWAGEITRKYGGWGWIIVVADTLDNAVAQLRSISDAHVEWASDSHAAGDSVCKVQCGDIYNDHSAWARHLTNVQRITEAANDRILKSLNIDVGIADEHLAPRDSIGKKLSSIIWKEVFSRKPKVIPLDHPMILSYYAGYDG